MQAKTKGVSLRPTVVQYKMKGNGDKKLFDRWRFKINIKPTVEKNGLKNETKSKLPIREKPINKNVFF